MTQHITHASLVTRILSLRYHGLPGFAVSYSASVLGGITAFLVFRFTAKRYFNKCIESQDFQHRYVTAIRRAVDRNGGKIVFLLRLTPLPYGASLKLYIDGKLRP